MTASASTNRYHDVSPDGERFVAVRSIADDRSVVVADSFTVVLNWFEELKARVPTGR